MAIDQLTHTHTSHSPFFSLETTPHTSPSHYATPSSARSAVKKFRYTEIDVSLYDNPRLKPHPLTEGVGQDVGGARDVSKYERHNYKEVKVKKTSLHEDILMFVGQEWRDLAVEVRKDRL